MRSQGLTGHQDPVDGLGGLPSIARLSLAQSELLLAFSARITNYIGSGRSHLSSSSCTFLYGGTARGIPGPRYVTMSVFSML